MSTFKPSDASLDARRQFLKLSSLFTAMGALPLLGMQRQAFAADPNAPLRIGYLPITDATPLLVAHNNGLFEQQGLTVEKPRLFRSWAQLVEAFLAGQVNAIHLLSPMTVWARYGSQSKAKVVAWNHMSGSGITVRNDINDVAQLGGTTVAIPFWYSLHNVVLQHLLKSKGLEPIADGEPNEKQVKLVVMAPSDMLPALANRQIAGYTVAEPFNASAELLKVGKVLRFTGDVWKDHACCVVLMHEEDTVNRPEWTQKVVNGIVQAQAWIQDNRDETARILSKDHAQRYTPHPYDTLAQVLVPERLDRARYEADGAIVNKDWQEKRIDFQPYPFPSYTEELVRRLKTTLVAGKNEFLETLDPAFVASDLVDSRFARKAIESIGGMPVFGMPASYERQEIITV
ncbi:ABC transporter substrate-binding protein [Neopusillimonas aromaticivorans]|jgi:NitT/TauT family transport system substrate-binding protein|uniref:ABC transporter substrate-binding protein n=1 Tax=Neopusillimonas aromaticivorans TaxID=2979868 RepID=UPI0025980F97|nr:ABC transporter substrate-binding protein [Neopusillimonas aromaticivorans]NLZ09796.1 ABC transporter substrate-binding protein [Alcaligenaceae bacterium]WJJ93211.1 ABC transporter substrate-binding protein [Neopusillimonas aromaticivorans]